MLLAHPPAFLQQLYPSLTWKIITEKKQIFLTFDDGPIPDVTDIVLDKLKAANAKAVFFCVGENIEQNPELFQRILAEGHKIGNHTYHHTNGWKSTAPVFIKDVEKFEKIYKSKLFRPPYGRLKSSQIKYLKKNYEIIMWSILTMDYSVSIAPSKCEQIATSGWENGSIIVLHDSKKAKTNMLRALDAILEKGTKEGWEFAAL